MTKYDIIVVTDSGCEQACVLEIARWIKARPATHANAVVLQGSIEDAALLGYKLQTARRVMIQLIPPQESLEIEAAIPPAIKELVKPGLTFKAEGEVLAMSLTGEETMSFLSQELIEAVGGWAKEQLGLAVKLSNPDLVVYAVKTPERIYVGLDVVGRPLAKRDWRIMLSRRSLKSTIAAATVIYAGAKETDVILDPISDDGTIAIEAALLLTRAGPRLFDRKFSFEHFLGKDLKEWRSVHDQRSEIERITAYGSSLHEMKAIRTNSKLAGVEKDIHATKVMMEWVDAKFEENSVDRIITAPIISGKSVTPQQVAKINEQLFYQAEYVLKKGKTLTAITEKPEELLASAEKNGFVKQEEHPVLMGKRAMTIMTFKNKRK